MKKYILINSIILFIIISAFTACDSSQEKTEYHIRNNSNNKQLSKAIVPTNLLANYLICYLGPGRFQQQIHIDVFMLDLLQFYKKIENKMPYKWGDKKLAIGNLPLGELVDKNVDISPLDKYKYVHSWTCK